MTAASVVALALKEAKLAEAGTKPLVARTMRWAKREGIAFSYLSP